MTRVSLVQSFPNIYQQLKIVNDEIDKSALSAGIS